jgi:hypothetical protein
MLRVEISGWDHAEQFFVERTTLEWGPGTETMAIVHRKVRPGTLLFLRLLEQTNPPSTFPIAYRVRELRKIAGRETYQVAMAQMWPAPPGGQADEHPRLDYSLSACRWVGFH